MNKSMIVLILLILTMGCIFVYANYSNEKERYLYSENNFSYGNLKINSNICESENETSWWKDDEGDYYIGDKPIIKDNCSFGGFSIRFSKESVLAMIEIMKDASGGVNE